MISSRGEWFLSKKQRIETMTINKNQFNTIIKKHNLKEREALIFIKESLKINRVIDICSYYDDMFKNKISVLKQEYFDVKKQVLRDFNHLIFENHN